MKLPAFKLLSKEQDRILNLPLDGSYLIAGPPGSGKTVVALYRAQMLHRRGESSVLMVFNQTLKTYVKAAAAELKISAQTVSYHSWLFSTYLHHYGTSPPMLNTFDHDWPLLLGKVNAQPPPHGSLPYLIVDEGQDLAPMFYQLARYIAKNVTVLADGNQVLHEQNSSLDEIRRNAMITHPPEILKTNYRNTRQIARLAACFHSGIETGIPELPSRNGPPIVLKRQYVRGQAIRSICLYQEQHPKSEIGVFLPDTKCVKDFAHRLLKELGPSAVQWYYKKSRLDDLAANNTLDFDKPAIRIMNYWNVKGLEFDAVFLPELQLFNQDLTSGRTKMLFYVLLSRARENLFMYYIKDDTALIRAMKEHLAAIGNVTDDRFDDDASA